MRFESLPDGAQLTLTHTGWELLGPRAAATRQAYQTGWDHVLACYTSLALPM